MEGLVCRGGGGGGGGGACFFMHTGSYVSSAINKCNLINRPADGYRWYDRSEVVDDIPAGEREDTGLEPAVVQQ